MRGLGWQACRHRVFQLESKGVDRKKAKRSCVEPLLPTIQERRVTHPKLRRMPAAIRDATAEEKVKRSQLNGPCVKNLVLAELADQETDVSSERSCPMIERQSDLHAGVAEWHTQRT